MARRSDHDTQRRQFLHQALSAGLTVCGVGCDRSDSRLPSASDAATPSAASSTTALQTSSTSPAAPATPKGPLGVALLGLGSYAEGQLAPGLQLTQHCKLTGLITGTPSKVPLWRQNYDVPEANVYSYETLPSIAQNAAIDVVYVVVPTALHAKYAIAAAEAGKHVWCEKPMAMTVVECQSIIDACKQNGVRLSVGYRMQHEPNTQTIIAYAKSRPYGAITSAKALSGYAGGGGTSWRFQKAMGGGALYDMGVYSVNGLRYAVGEEPVRVKSARQWTDRPQLFTEVDESTEFELEFASGLVGYGRTSVGEDINQLRVECERGSYELQPMQTYTGVQGQTSDGVLLNLPIQHQQAKQMDDDALAIIEDRPVLVPGEEGLRDIRLVQAIMQSASTGQPVTISG